jgi:FkbM family methyltransferase
MEPCEANYNILVSNLKTNDIRNVTPIKAGIAATNGTADMFLSRSWNNSLFKQYGEILNDTKAPQAVTIEVYSLREILDRYHLDHVDFMKLDCEGAEYPALFGADTETLCRIRTISMEFHDIRDPRYTGLSVVEVLRDQGFSVAHFNYSPTKRNLNFGKIVATRL